MDELLQMVKKCAEIIDKLGENQKKLTDVVKMQNMKIQELQTRVKELEALAAIEYND